MSETSDFRRYQHEAGSLAGFPAANHLRLVEALEETEQAKEPPWTRGTIALFLEGWQHKVRGGKRIWRENETRGWLSEEIAHHFMQRGGRP